jgi:hypothetical protein
MRTAESTTSAAVTTVKTDGKFGGYDIESLGKRPPDGRGEPHDVAPGQWRARWAETGFLAVSSITANLQIRANAGAGVVTRQIAERVAALAAP